MEAFCGGIFDFDPLVFNIRGNSCNWQISTSALCAPKTVPYSGTRDRSLINTCRYDQMDV